MLFLFWCSGVIGLGLLFFLAGGLCIFLVVVELLKADLGCSGVCFWAIYFGNGRFFGMLGVGPWSFERGTYL